MPEREAEQIGPGEGTGRPFGLGEIVSARMKKLVDSIELRLYQGGSVHICSAFLNNVNVICVSRNDGVKGILLPQILFFLFSLFRREQDHALST